MSSVLPSNPDSQAIAEAGADAASAASDATPPSYSPFAWLLAWAVFLLIMALINRTRIGHAAIYYALALLLFFLVVTQAAWIAGALAPLASLRNPNPPDSVASVAGGVQQVANHKTQSQPAS